MYPPTDIALKVRDRYLLSANMPGKIVIDKIDINRNLMRKMSFGEKVNFISKKIYDEIGVHPFNNTKYRGRDHVVSRQLLMYFLHNYTKISDNKIAGLLGKDHATINHALKTIENLKDTDKDFAEQVSRIDEIVKKKIQV